MKKQVRKILTLALALALVCALAAAVFAARIEYADESFYRFDACAEASIDQYSTTIEITTAGLTEVNKTVGTVTCNTNYENLSGAIIADSFSRTVNKNNGSYVYTKMYSDEDCKRMRTAIYVVDVEFATVYGTYEFNPSSILVTYP